MNKPSQDDFNGERFISKENIRIVLISLKGKGAILLDDLDLGLLRKASEKP